MAEKVIINKNKLREGDEIGRRGDGDAGVDGSRGNGGEKRKRDGDGNRNVWLEETRTSHVLFFYHFRG